MMPEVGQYWDTMLGTQREYLVASNHSLLLGGEDPVTEAGAGHPCEAKPPCPAQGQLQNKKISSGAVKAS